MGNENNPEQFPHQDKIIDMDSLHDMVRKQDQEQFNDSSEIRFCNRCSTIIQDGIWCTACADVIGKG